MAIKFSVRTNSPEGQVAPAPRAVNAPPTFPTLLHESVLLGLSQIVNLKDDRATLAKVSHGALCASQLTKGITT